jgi:large subunit ribosomal protein L9
MEVILKEDIEKLGSEGEVVEVADGYARNFLFPRRLAVKATKGKLKHLKHRRNKKQKKEAEQIKDAKKMAKDLEGQKFKFPVKAGENGRLFGSVTTKNIAKKVKKAGYKIDKREIDLDDNIKSLGIHKVPVKLYKKVVADLKIEVVEK